jgi:hypothetical protein
MIVVPGVHSIEGDAAVRPLIGIDYLCQEALTIDFANRPITHGLSEGHLPTRGVSTA